MDVLEASFLMLITIAFLYILHQIFVNLNNPPKQFVNVVDSINIKSYLQSFLTYKNSSIVIGIISSTYVIITILQNIVPFINNLYEKVTKWIESYTKYLEDSMHDQNIQYVGVFEKDVEYVSKKIAEILQLSDEVQTSFANTYTSLIEWYINIKFILNSYFLMLDSYFKQVVFTEQEILLIVIGILFITTFAFIYNISKEGEDVLKPRNDLEATLNLLHEAVNKHKKKNVFSRSTEKMKNIPNNMLDLYKNDEILCNEIFILVKTIFDSLKTPNINNINIEYAILAQQVYNLYLDYYVDSNNTGEYSSLYCCRKLDFFILKALYEDVFRSHSHISEIQTKFLPAGDDYRIIDIYQTEFINSLVPENVKIQISRIMNCSFNTYLNDILIETKDSLGNFKYSLKDPLETRLYILSVKKLF